MTKIPGLSTHDYTLVPCTLELHLGTETIQERRYMLIKIAQILGSVFYRYKQVLDLYLETRSLCACVRHWWRGACIARRIHKHANATLVVHHNAQYAKLLARQGFSTVYYAQNNPRASENLLANEILTYCAFGQWEVAERPKMQGISVMQSLNRDVPISSSKVHLLLIAYKNCEICAISILLSLSLLYSNKNKLRDTLPFRNNIGNILYIAFIPMTLFSSPFECISFQPTRGCNIKLMYQFT